jgi:hypothetical protein
MRRRAVSWAAATLASPVSGSRRLAETSLPDEMSVLTIEDGVARPFRGVRCGRLWEFALMTTSPDLRRSPNDAVVSVLG